MRAFGNANPIELHVATSDAEGSLTTRSVDANSSAFTLEVGDALGMERVNANPVELRVSTSDATGLLLQIHAINANSVDLDVATSDAIGRRLNQTADANRIDFSVIPSRPAGRRLRRLRGNANHIDIFRLFASRATGRIQTAFGDGNEVELHVDTSDADGRQLQTDAHTVDANPVELRVSTSDATGLLLRTHTVAGNSVDLHVATSDASGLVPTQTGIANPSVFEVRSSRPAGRRLRRLRGNANHIDIFRLFASRATGRVPKGIGDGNEVELHVDTSDAIGRRLQIHTVAGNSVDFDVSTSDAEGRRLQARAVANPVEIHVDTSDGTGRRLRANTVDANPVEIHVDTSDATGEQVHEGTGPGRNSARPWFTTDSSGSTDAMVLEAGGEVDIAESVWGTFLNRVLHIRICIQGDWDNADTEGLRIESRILNTDAWELRTLIRGWVYSDFYDVGDQLQVYGGPGRVCVEAGGWADVDVEIPDAHRHVRLIPSIDLSGGSPARQDIALHSASFTWRLNTTHIDLEIAVSDAVGRVA